MQITCPSCSGVFDVDDDVADHGTDCHEPGDAKDRQTNAVCVHCGQPVNVVSAAATEVTTDWSPDQEPAADHASTATILTGTGSGGIDASEADTTGRQFGDYELLDEIARGGMGVVYRARQSRLNRVVALKMILSGQLASDSDVQRFYTEAEAAAGLDHPGIVPVFEVGEQAGQHFFSMGFVDGGSLSDRVTDGPLPPDKAAELTMQTAEAIAYAHDQGVIHRDLKPANILLDRDGQPRITDFGLARKFKENSGLTASGQILGTPGYMPPEQAGGDVENIGPAADVYSLGAILYCLITGRPPFQAASIVDTLMQVREQEPVSPRQLNPEIDVDLETICLKCLAKEPDRRYGSARELVDELQRFLVGVPIQARPVGRVARTWRWCKRKPVLAALTATVTALVVFVAIAAPIVAYHQTGLRQQADASAADAVRLQGLAEGNARTAERRAESERHAKAEAERASDELAEEKQRAIANLYGTTIALAYREWLDNNVVRANQLLLEAPTEYRHWEWHYLKSLCHTERFNFTGHSGAIVATRFSHDSRYLATASEDRTIRLWDMRSGTLTRTHELPKGVFALGPDGRRYVTVGSEVQIHDLINGSLLSRLTSLQSGERVRSVALNFDGTHVAICIEPPPDAAEGNPEEPANRFEVRIIDTNNGEAVSTLSGIDANDNSPLAFSRDGRRIVTTAHRRNSAAIWDVNTGERLNVLVGHVISIATCDFSPDGSLVATASFGGIIKLWDAATGEEWGALHGHVDWVAGLQFSHDGNWLMSCGKDRSVRIWDPESGLKVLTVRGNTHYVISVAMSPDGKWLASGGVGQSAMVWSVDGLLGLDDGVPPELTATFLADAQVESDQQRDALMRGLHGIHYDHLSLQWRSIYGHAGPVTGIAFTDGGTFASGSLDDKVRFARASDGQIVHSVTHDARVLDLAASVDAGMTAAALRGSEADRVKVWDSKTGDEKLSLDGPAPRTARVAISPGGRYVAAGAESNRGSDPVEVKVWDAASGELLHTLNGHTSRIFDVTFSPDGSTLLSCGRNAMRMWDVVTGEEKWKSDILTFSAAASPDGEVLATAHADGFIRLWNSDSGERIGEMEGPQVLLNSIVWTPDGRRIITGSENATISVWDPQTRLQLLTMRGHTHQVLHVAISPDGRRIASASRDGAVNVWDAGEASVASDSSTWPVVYADEFGGDGIADEWSMGHGDWRIGDGQLVGQIRSTQIRGQDVSHAVATLSGVDLPDEIEIACDVTTKALTNWQVGLAGPEGRAVMVELAAVEHPALLAKGAIFWIANGPGNFSQPVINRQFRFVPGETYRVRFVRMADNVRVLVDDDEVVSTRLNFADTPTLILQGLHGADGAEFSVDNLQVRASRAAIRRRDARILVTELIDEYLLPADVAAALERDDSLDPDLRATAVELLDTLPLNTSAMNEAAWQIIRNQSTTSAERERAVRLAEAALSRSPDSPRDLTALGAALFNAGRTAEAVETLRRARGRLIETRGATSPVCLTFLTAALHANGDAEAALKRYSQLRDFVASHDWKPDPLLDGLVANANESLGSSIPDTPDRYDRSTIRKLIIDTQQRGVTQHHIDDYLSAWSDVGEITLGRGQETDQYDVTLDFSRLRDWIALQLAGYPARATTIWPERIEVRTTGDNATADVTEALQTTSTFEERQARYQLRRQDGQWKIVSLRQWKTRSMRRGKITVFDESHFAERDAAVEAARLAGNDRQLVDELVGAGRNAEAYELLKRLTGQTPNAYLLWEKRFGRALALGEAADALNSHRQLMRIAPKDGPLRTRLMTLSAALNQPNTAVAQLQRMPASSPSDLHLRLLQATAFAKEQIRLSRFTAADRTDFLNQELTRIQQQATMSDGDVNAFKAWISTKQVWHISGVLEGGDGFEGFDRTTPVEEAPSLDTLHLVSPTDSVRQRKSAPGAYINLLRSGTTSNAVAYALAFIESDKAQTVNFQFGSDDAGKIWVNGKLVHTARANRVYRTASDSFTASLHPGVNTLLVKISQNIGAWGFGIDVTDSRGVPADIRWPGQAGGSASVLE